MNRDISMAITLYDYTCSNGQIGGCYYLAQMYRRGKGVAENKSIAKTYYAKACKLGSSSGCSKYRRLDEEGVR